jgi:hypothetical protein
MPSPGNPMKQKPLSETPYPLDGAGSSIAPGVEIPAENKRQAKGRFGFFSSNFTPFLEKKSYRNEFNLNLVKFYKKVEEAKRLFFSRIEGSKKYRIN